MKILMVCLGNICRSPLAEGIMRSKLPEDFIVDSAGTIDMHQGSNPDKRSVKTAAKYGIDISKQLSRPITTEDLNHFDKIYCMDLSNLKKCNFFGSKRRAAKQNFIVDGSCRSQSCFWRSSGSLLGRNRWL